MSSKPYMIFCGPVKTVSGYGSHARDLVLSLIQMDKFDIKIMSINWGDTPMNALDENNPEHFEILSRITKDPVSVKPDIWVQCTIPTEFQPIGKYNIGITAGIETNLCSPEWIEGCNKMDLLLVPSDHAKRVFEETTYEKRDRTSGELIQLVKLNKPIEVLHEGVRTDIFNRENKPVQSVSDELSKIKEDFCFLFVGHWLKGDFGQDRKDVSGLIHTFLNTFKDTKNPPALVLKTSMGTFSLTGLTELKKRIDGIKKMVDAKKLPNIYLLFGDLNEFEMNSLYNHTKIKAFVSFTKGEGYGRPIAEFMRSGKPVIVSGWSGHIDFVNPNNNILLPGELQKVHSSAVWNTIINEGSSWFTVDYQTASKILKDVYSNYQQYKSKSKISILEIKDNWSYKKMSDKFKKILNEKLPTFTERITLTLPTTKKPSEIS
jgi:glycosyltransferase involved in cell wall biosynthesis